MNLFLCDTSPKPTHKYIYICETNKPGAILAVKPRFAFAAANVGSAAFIFPAVSFKNVKAVSCNCFADES
jgi:hypothetical protein